MQFFVYTHLNGKTVIFQTIQFSMSKQFKCQKQFYFKLFSLVNKVKWFQVLLCTLNNSIKHHLFFYTQFNVKTVLFQAIQFSISAQFSSIWPKDITLSGTTTLGQCGPGSDSKKGVLRIPQNSNITGVSPPDCLVSFLGHSLGKFYPPAEI